MEIRHSALLSTAEALRLPLTSNGILGGRHACAVPTTAVIIQVPVALAAAGFAMT